VLVDSRKQGRPIPSVAVAEIKKSKSIGVLCDAVVSAWASRLAGFGGAGEKRRPSKARRATMMTARTSKKAVAFLCFCYCIAFVSIRTVHCLSSLWLLLEEENCFQDEW